VVSDKSPRKTTTKKPGKSVKEKRAAKKEKKSEKGTSFLPPSH
jgi:hypothetical protein